MNRTKIEWCDYTWNPIVGCSPISDGCKHCYAARISKRFGLPWGKAHFVTNRLDEPFKVQRPSIIFVCSMSDLGHKTVKSEWLKAIADVMRNGPRHQYIVLTKRPGPWLRLLPKNVWVGVTIESQDYIGRWSELYECAWQSAIKFVSVEPMLGSVTFENHEHKPDWVICGPETGPFARNCDDRWIERLMKENRCFFDKRKIGWKLRQFPAALDPVYGFLCTGTP